MLSKTRPVQFKKQKIHAPLARPKRSARNDETKHIVVPHMDCGAEIALYYGFTPTDSPEIKRSDLEQSKALLEGDFVEDEGGEEGATLPLHVEEKVAMLRTYFEKELFTSPHPAMFHFKGSFKGSLTRKANAYSRYCDLEIIGTDTSIAEATLLRTALAILEAEGHTNLHIEINSIGDKDAVFKFTRELTNYYRKNIESLPPHCRQTFKKDVFELLSCNNPKCHELRDAAPKSMSFLSEASRDHFREVLEHLETFNVPYTINHSLVGNRRYTSETIFEIVSEADSVAASKKKILALGVRYDGLSKKIGFKKEVAAAGISLFLKKPSEVKRGTHTIKRPTIFFIQLGFEAKLMSFTIIDTLRQHNIQVYQSLGRDKLAMQLSMAEKHPITHTVLIGKKEALERSVIVRDMKTRSQDIIMITELPGYLKKLKV
ncbi:MAG TPA: ATP phosphoribosyltransferase regulatory subunit [Candidatus Paceibacterota bacterium]